MATALKVVTVAGVPARILWRGRWLKVARVLDFWKDMGRWWAGEEEKVFFRLELAAGIVGELCYEMATQRWCWYRVYD